MASTKLSAPMPGTVPQRNVTKVGRNEPCPCGSGKKYKDCHYAEGQAFLDKLALQEEQRRRKEHRQRLKDQGVPWYRRLFAR